MTKYCDNCGSAVSDRYFKVMAIEGILRDCQHCRNKHNDSYAKR